MPSLRSASVPTLPFTSWTDSDDEPLNHKNVDGGGQMDERRSSRPGSHLNQTISLISRHRPRNFKRIFFVNVISATHKDFHYIISRFLSHCLLGLLKMIRLSLNAIVDYFCFLLYISCHLLTIGSFKVRLDEISKISQNRIFILDHIF